jgi:GR25 family glycosyltransferase involved in LPS biosynthesis
VAIVSNVAVFCISLKDSPRRPTFAASAAAHSVAFEFIDAIAPADLRQGAGIDGCRVDSTDLRWTYHERNDPRRQQAPLMFAEIGCAYSHMTCWRTGRARDLDYICVFEDDAVIGRNPNGIGIPDATDMLYLSDRMPHNERSEITGQGCGTEGYILSRAGILKCLEIFSVLYMPVDLQVMAHQACQIENGSGLCEYRRNIDSRYYLNARAATEPYCRHPDDGESQIYVPDLERAIAERDRLRLQLEVLHRSACWRLTAPVRAIQSAFARPPRGAARG